VFNGQIYNFKEIKAELQDYPYSTTSDTEVILAAYTRWGERCLDRMNGMFTIAIYDSVDQSLFVARDRLGVKPLYFSLTHKHFIFGSEIRALLASGLVRNKMGDSGLLEYFMHQSTPSPGTILEDVFQIRPAHFVIVKDGKFSQHRYWDFGTSDKEAPSDYTVATKSVRKLLLQSVERRMISDVPLGAFLSGGIDSSAVVALMAQVSDRVSTFSVTFDEEEYDESRFSQRIATQYRTDHHPILLNPGLMLDELPNALDAMDSPSTDGINTYVISKYTKAAGLTVALSGLGSDELFAGYHYFRMWKRLKQNSFFMLPGGLRRAVMRLLYRNADSSRLERMEQLALSDGSIGETYPAFRQVSGRGTALALMSHEHSARISNVGKDNSLNGNMDQHPLLSQFSIAELTNYTLNVLLKDTDQFSMASALEVREPYFDYKLVDYVLMLPDKWKLGKTPKKLLTDAMGNLLPTEIINRPKRGFLLPWEHWLKHELSGFAKERIDYLADRPEFAGDKIQEAWTTFMKNPKGTTWPYVWQLVALSHWIKKNLD
jgi:asparagine synthase (glutamine-hydrolysing)